MRSLERTLTTFALFMAMLLASMAAIAAVPKQLKLEYVLLQQGNPIATVSEQLDVSGKQYRLRSVTQGMGLYKLLGERILTSEGSIRKGQLQPSHFEVQQSKRPAKALINDFDWQQKRLSLQVKGETHTEALTSGAQDLLSAMYCWLWQPPKGAQISLNVTNGKKLSRQQFKVTQEAAPLETKAGNFQVVKLAEQDGDKIVYLAKDQGYLPVKIVVIDDGKRMEQVLTSLSRQ